MSLDLARPALKTPIRFACMRCICLHPPATGFASERTTMAFVLGTNNHGKGRVRLLKVSQLSWVEDRQPRPCA